MRFENVRDLGSFVQPLMEGFGAPWCVAGGWAIDLFLGRETRTHADIELAVFRSDQALLHSHFRGWHFEKIVDGHRHDWNEADWLALPVHELHACSQGSSLRSIEFLLNERDADDWIFRRNSAIRLQMGRAIALTNAGVPILSPEVVLLFKAKSPRAKDEDDFRIAEAQLSAERGRWLHRSLEQCHPGHPWLGRLAVSLEGDGIVSRNSK